MIYSIRKKCILFYIDQNSLSLYCDYLEDRSLGRVDTIQLALRRTAWRKHLVRNMNFSCDFPGRNKYVRVKFRYMYADESVSGTLFCKSLLTLIYSPLYNQIRMGEYDYV